MVWLEEFKRYVAKDGLVYSKTRGDKLKQYYHDRYLRRKSNAEADN